MFRTTLKNLAARKLRLLTTSLAVLLGVAFMAGTLVLTDTIGKTFDDLFADVNAGTDAYVRGEAAFDRRACSATSGPASTPRWSTPVAAVDGVAAAEGDVEAYAQVVDKRRRADRQPATWARPTFGGNWLTDDEPQPVRPRRGPAPPRPTTRSSSTGAAPTTGDFAVGDTDHRAHPGRARAGRGRRHRHVRRRRQPRRRVVRPVHRRGGPGRT